MAQRKTGYQALWCDKKLVEVHAPMAEMSDVSLFKERANAAC